MDETRDIEPVQPPKNQADLERFWADVERAAAERDDQTEYVIFDSFYGG